MNKHVGSFWEHVLLLRRHIILGGLFFISTVIAVYVQYSEKLIILLLQPIRGETLAFLSPMGPFLFKIKISMYGALSVAVPVWLLLLIDFISPALMPRKKLVTIIFIALSLTLSAGALYLTYSFLLPITLEFLIGIVVPGTTLFLTAESYLSFFFLQFIVLLVVAQLPLLIILLSYLRILSPFWLTKQRRYLYIGLLVLFAILTPTTDAATLIAVVIPAICLTELGIIISTLLYKKEII